MTATLPHPEHPFQELRTLSRNHLWRALTFAGLAHVSLIALTLVSGTETKPVPGFIIIDSWQFDHSKPPDGGGGLSRRPKPPTTKVFVPQTPLKPVNAAQLDSLEFAESSSDSSWQDGKQPYGGSVEDPTLAGGRGDEILPPPPPGQYVPFEEAPTPITAIRPVYPRLALDAGVEGTVLLLAFVGKDGAVKELRVVRGIPMLDEAAIDAVRRATFRPALQNANPVAVWVSVPVVFRIRR